MTGGLIGRAGELAALRRLLAQGRLVTVVGAAGVGKSALAAHAAAAVSGQLPDGVVRVRWWDGAPARRQSAVQALAEALDGGTAERAEDPKGGARRPVDGSDVVARLVGRRVLILLDDIDPVRQECARLVQAVLQQAPGVRLLVTGRHPMGLGHESVLRLRPLATTEPDEKGAGGRAAARGQEAEDVSPGPAQDPGNSGLVRDSGNTGPVQDSASTGPVQDSASTATTHDPGNPEPVQDPENSRPLQDSASTTTTPGPRRSGTAGAPGNTLDAALAGDVAAGRAAGAESADPPAPRPGPAVALFVARALALRRDRDDAHPFSAEAESRTVLDLCAALEGVPLAIELAATESASTSVTQVAGLLGLGHGWLGAPDAPLRRHRSVRAAVGASYALCDRAERSTWARLSVFEGDFDEDAATYVCAGGGLGAHEVPSCLARLALASVLETVRGPGGVLPPRYRLSAAARGFAAERLEAAGEVAAARGRHLGWYAQVAAGAHQLWSTGRHERATRLVRDEERQLYAALEHGPDHGDRGVAALAMVRDLWFWWAVCGQLTRGREQLRRLLPLARADTRLCGQALWLAGWLAVCAGDAGAEELLRQAWRVAVLSGDDATVGRVAHAEGTLALRAGQTERAIERLREAADTIPAHAVHGPSAAVSLAVLTVAQAAVRPAEALRSARRATARPQARHDAWTHAMTQYAHALVELARGRRSRAWRRAHQALAAVTEVPSAAGAATVRALIAAIEGRSGQRAGGEGGGGGCAAARATRAT
ncbi:AAA family ATPase [Streptomyces sp. NPDC059009]|uniref:AAA family ATPase n=1 Tax=Streptomyces sp. NPDC059009 TaxID=3346694 RepID=UPI0036CB0FA9